MNEHLDGIYLCCQNVHALVDVRTHHLYIYIYIDMYTFGLHMSCKKMKATCVV